MAFGYRGVGVTNNGARGMEWWFSLTCCFPGRW